MDIILWPNSKYYNYQRIFHTNSIHTFQIIKYYYNLLFIDNNKAECVKKKSVIKIIIYIYNCYNYAL